MSADAASTSPQPPPADLTEPQPVAVNPVVPYPAALPPVFDFARHEETATGRAASISGSDARRRWVEEQLTHYEPEYCEMQPASVVAITFNVGCNKPPADMNWILGEGVKGPRDRAAPDLVVIGLQEVDMSAGALLRLETEASTPWLRGVASALQLSTEDLAACGDAAAAAALQSSQAGGTSIQSSSPSDPPYRLLAQRQLVGLMLIVAVKATAASHVQNAHVNTIATGALGTMANKGAIGFRCNYRLSSLCFVNCHLAAHQNGVAKRNQDIAQILAGLNMAPPASAAGGAVLLPKQHDMCVVLGDLNYRINLGYDAAVQAAKRNDVAYLMKEDQLVREMGSVHTPWSGFTDLLPKFKPTYKFDDNSDVYDTSEKKRVPSWTDRILYCPRDPLHRGVEVVWHDMVANVRTSDHRPVLARLNVPVKVADPERRAAVEKRLEGLLAKSGSNVPVPHIRCSSNDLGFGRVSYLTAATRTVEVTNTGDTAVELSVARQTGPDRDPTDGAWLRVTPSSLTILPGRKATLTIAAVVDWTSLRWAVNERPFAGREKGAFSVCSVVMLAVRAGPAMPIMCACDIELGSFGVALDALLDCGCVPAATAFAGTPADGEKERAQAQETYGQWPAVSKELWTLVDALARGKAATTRGVFGADGDDAGADPAQIRRIIRHLDTSRAPLNIDLNGQTAAADEETADGGRTDDSNSPVDVDAVAATLHLFLRDVQLAVIPPTHHAAALQAGKLKSDAAVAAVVKTLPVNHHNALLYLVSFARFLTRPEHTTESGLNAEALCTAWAPLLFALSPQARPGVFSGAATGAGALALRKELEAELQAARQFLMCLVAGKPELGQ